jgi:type VI secretion system secreted protein Hcp
MKVKHAVLSIALLAVCFVSMKPAGAQIPGAMNQANLSFSVKITGKVTGQFRGESTLKGRENSIEGLRFSSQVTSPRDIATGLPSGKRQHSPITFTKIWGPASPQIFQACVTNELLPTVKFEFWKVLPGGREVIFQTIALTNASISSVRRYIGVASGGDAPDPRELEDVTLTFQKIEIQDNAAGGLAAADSWMAAK